MASHDHHPPKDGIDVTIIADPDALHRLRSTVEDWVDRAQHAVWTFKRDNGSFRRDSKKPNHSSITTTARCYMALAYVERQPSGLDRSVLDWQPQFEQYQGNFPFQLKAEKFVISEPREGEKPNENLNNFEIAHLADFSFVRRFSERYNYTNSDNTPDQQSEPQCQSSDLDKQISEALSRLLCHSSDATSEAPTEIPFDADAESSKHYFVTLHILRALELLSWDAEPCRPLITKIAEDAR